MTKAKTKMETKTEVKEDIEFSLDLRSVAKLWEDMKGGGSSLYSYNSACVTLNYLGDKTFLAETSNNNQTMYVKAMITSYADTLKMNKGEQISLDLGGLRSILKRFATTTPYYKQIKNVMQLSSDDRKFELALTSSDEDKAPFNPDTIESSNKFSVDSISFKEVLKDANAVNSHITFEVDKQDLKLKSVGRTATYSNKLTINTDIDNKFEDCIATYSIDSLLLASKHLDGSIHIEIGKEKPILILKDGSYTFAVAPYVEDEYMQNTAEEDDEEYEEEDEEAD